MEHQHKNPNQHQAVARARNQTAPVADSQDLQTMEYVDQQDVVGNDFVAEHIPATAQGIEQGGASPWDVNLFSASQAGMNDVEWAKEGKSTHNLKGRPRTGTKTLHKDKNVLAEGEHGDFTYQNTVRMRRMAGASLSYDGGRVNTQERSGEVNGISVSDKESQEYIGGGSFDRYSDRESKKTVYGGVRGEHQSVAKANVADGELQQSRSGSYAVNAKRDKGTDTGSIDLKEAGSNRFDSSIDGVDTIEERGHTRGVKANVSHNKDSIMGTVGGDFGRRRSLSSSEQHENGILEQINLTTGQNISGQVERTADGSFSVSGKAGANGSASRQLDSVDDLGRSVRNTVHARGSADIQGSHNSTKSNLTANIDGSVGAGKEVNWSNGGGEHKQSSGVNLSGGAKHNVGTGGTDLKSNLSANRTDKTVETVNDHTTQTRTLEQGLTGGAKAKLDNGSLVQDSIAINGGYNIAHRTEDHTKKENKDTKGTVSHKVGVTGVIDEKQRNLGANYTLKKGNKNTETIGNVAQSTNSGFTASTSGNHDLKTDKSSLKGDLSYSTGSSTKTQVDPQTEKRSGRQNDFNVGGSVALEENAKKVGAVTKNAGYAFTKTAGETVTANGRTDSLDHTNKSAANISNKGDGVVLGVDHDYTRAQASTWTKEAESHAVNNKLTVGGGTKFNHKTDDLDVAARVGFSRGNSITKQINPTTKEIQGVTHDVSGAVNADIDKDTTSVDDSSVQASYGVGINQSVEKQTEKGKETNSSGHKLTAKSDLQRNAQSADLSYVYSSGKKIETDKGYKENSNSHKMTLGGKQTIDRATEEDKKKQEIRAGYSLSNSDKEVSKAGGETITNTKTNTIGGDVGYNVQDKKFSTGLIGSYKSEEKHADGSKIISKHENSATIDQNGKGTLARKTEDIGYEKVTNPTDETRIKTRKGVFSSEISASTQKEADGNRSLGMGGKLGYSAFKRDLSFTAKSMSGKVSGLRQGDKDVDGQDKVRTLQKSLNKAGQTIEVNGIFDTATAAAVEKFQKANSLAVTPQGEIDAQTAASLPNVRMLPEGTKFSASYQAGTVSADANVKSTFKADQIKVEGVAGAKVTMVGGNAKISLPVFNWNLGGEAMAVAVTAGVHAEVLAEANGNIKMDVGKSDNGINAHIEGGGKAFVGAKAGVEVGAEVQWKRNSAQYYGDLIKKFASSLPGSWDDHLVDKVPDEIWPQLAQVLIGTRRSTIMYARAGVEGHAGLGAEATFNAGIKNGMIEASGSLGGSFGLGGSAKTSVGLHAVDGVRLGGVLAMKGATWLADALPAAKNWLKEVEVELDKKLDAYLEEKKKQGGVGGFFAGAVDFVGDDLLNLW